MGTDISKISHESHSDSDSVDAVSRTSVISWSGSYSSGGGSSLGFHRVGGFPGWEPILGDLGEVDDEFGDAGIPPPPDSPVIRRRSSNTKLQIEPDSHLEDIEQELENLSDKSVIGDDVEKLSQDDEDNL